MNGAGPWALVGWLWLAALLNYVDRQVLFAVFALLRSGLGLSDPQLGMLGAVFLWCYGLASPLAGYLGDRLGHRLVIVLSVVLWSAMTLLTGLSRSFAQLLLSRALIGLSEALYLPAALALIARYHQESTRARAVGLHQSGIYAGIVLGGALGGWMGQQYGWQTPFLVLGGAGLLYGICLQALLPQSERRSLASKARLGGSLASVWRSPGYPAVLLVFGCVSICNWLVYSWMPLFLYERFRLSLAEAGFAATFWVQGASVAGILLGGALADKLVLRHRRARIFIQSAALLAAAPFLMLAPLASAPAVCYLGLAMFGLGRGAYDSNVMPALCGMVPAAQRATAYGMLNCFAVVVGGLATYAAGALKAGIGISGALFLAGLLLLASAPVLLAVPPPVFRAAPVVDPRGQAQR